MNQTRISGWGNFPVSQGQLWLPRRIGDVQDYLGDAAPAIAPRGNGRSYGDSSFSAHGAIASLRLNRMLAFDTQNGVFCCEAGVLLKDIISAILSHGWFIPVSPGTKYVTVGGMIAADVHGKNAVIDGTFGRHVDWIDLMQADGSEIRCSRTQNKDLFLATLGGMGLTGFILRAQFRLKPIETGWIAQTRKIAGNLDELFAQFEESENATYRVAWIDVLQSGANLGRGLLDIGEHATLDQLAESQAAERYPLHAKGKINVPFAPPISPLNRFSVKAFNAVYYRLGKRAAGSSVIGWDGYFYPLDSLLNWNRIYGRRGFAQYQCVLPRSTSPEGIRALLQAISASGAGSFLAVLKRLGTSEGLISFPMDGYTLALDFPWSRRVAKLLDRLDDIVLDHGGRLYLAKDSRMSAGTFAQMQNGRDSLIQLRQSLGLRSKFATLQSERLEL